MKGTVQVWTQTEDFGFGIIRDDDYRKWRVSGGQIELDAVGRSLLVPGEPVEFEQGKHTDKRQKTHIVAVNVKRPWKDTQTDPWTHREICKVKNKNWLIRMVGGLLVTSMDDPHIGQLLPGQIIECGVEECPGYSAWKAIDIKILARSEESFDWTVEASHD